MGLARTIFQQIPEADTYQVRIPAHQEHDATTMSRNTPGTISVHGQIVNMYAQYKLGYPKWMYDTRHSRKKWFRNFLWALRDRIGSEAPFIIAMPKYIGSNMAGGD